MNERIEQLADRAGLGMLTNPDDTWAKYLEKFAELIVKECAAHLNFVGDEYAGIELLEHFGVEE